MILSLAVPARAGCGVVRRASVVVVLGALLQACGGGGGDGSTAGAVGNTPAPNPTNSAPSITGTAATLVDTGNPYTFTPTASDPDGDSLTFSIQNKPGWASFDSSTGRLNGTPTSTGTFSGITIRVSDGKTDASLAAFSISVRSATQVTTGSASLSWTPPTQRNDGSALTNLAGYRIRYGTALGDYPNTINVANPGLSSYVVDELTADTYYFVISAYDATGAESAYSDAVSKTIT